MPDEDMQEELAISLQNAIEAITGDAFPDSDALALADYVIFKHELERKK